MLTRTLNSWIDCRAGLLVATISLLMPGIALGDQQEKDLLWIRGNRGTTSENYHSRPHPSSKRRDPHQSPQHRHRRLRDWIAYLPDFGA
jgi:hypothetical protein